VTTGPVSVAEVRARLGGAPRSTEEELQAALDVAVAHVVPLLREPYRDPVEWPDDLHDGILAAAVLTYRNAESPTAPPEEDLGRSRKAPAVPPFAWDDRIRQRWAPYMAGGVWVG
jgi:hypothetical protein